MQCSARWRIRLLSTRLLGPQVATGGDDGAVRVWCAATGELARVVLSGASRVRAVAFSEVNDFTNRPLPAVGERLVKHSLWVP
jgi:hypothetical protein